jgi:myosin-1
MNDAKEFQIVEEATRDIGLDEDTVTSMWELMSAILWLGNTTFGGTSSGSSKKNHSRSKSVTAKLDDSSYDALNNAASLLGIDSNVLIHALTNRTVVAGMETMVKPLNSDEAIYTRDALAKALYSKNFSQLVKEINRNINGNGELEIGILDIYGFEIFETNSFEQLCINFCNEKLQQVFIQLTLKSEQDEYKSEGIEWTPVKFFNNKIVCDLVEKKNPAGILAYLDEESIYPNGSDDSLMSKFKKNLTKHKHFEVANDKVRSSTTDRIFVIKHFAGNVNYCVDGFLEKNRDTLFRDLIDSCGSSKKKYVQNLFPESLKSSSKKRPPTAGNQFKKSMSDLVKTLMACTPHYIRCIKPNDMKKSSVYNDERVKHQVKYLGLLENVKVKRAGFAFRTTYIDFVKRYKMLGQLKNYEEKKKTVINRLIS